MPLHSKARCPHVAIDLITQSTCRICDSGDEETTVKSVEAIMPQTPFHFAAFA